MAAPQARKFWGFLCLENMIFFTKIMFLEHFRNVVQAVRTKNPKIFADIMFPVVRIPPLVTDGSLTRGGILTKGGNSDGESH